MPDNPLVQEILGLVDEVFSDTTVPKSQTLAWMEEIQSAVQANIDALKDDLTQEEEEEEEGESDEDGEGALIWPISLIIGVVGFVKGLGRHLLEANVLTQEELERHFALEGEETGMDDMAEA